MNDINSMISQNPKRKNPKNTNLSQKVTVLQKCPGSAKTTTMQDWTHVDLGKPHTCAPSPTRIETALVNNKSAATQGVRGCEIWMNPSSIPSNQLPHFHFRQAVADILNDEEYGWFFSD